MIVPRFRPRIDGPLRIRAARIPALWLLRAMARQVVWRRRPVVVSVTGSVGKTTTKDLIAAVLSRDFEVWTTSENAGGEVGASLAVLGPVHGHRWFRSGESIRSWLRAYLSGLALLSGRRSYPEVLVLEMAAGRPGELRRLTRAVSPDIAVVTDLDGTHLEHFGTIEAIAAEKAWTVRRLRSRGLAVLNADNDRVRAMAKLTKQGVITVGTVDEADLRAEQVRSTPDGLLAEVSGRLPGGGPVERFPLASPLLGPRRVTNVLAALAVADALGVETAKALEVIRGFRGPPARLRPLRGRGGLTVLDDSYNASPEAMKNALEALRGFPGPRTAVLGEMSGLGPLHESAHREIGQALAPWLDELVAVGAGGRLIAAAAVEHGMDAARVKSVTDADAAARVVSANGGGGAVLVKGAHALALERVTRALLLDPGDEAAFAWDDPPG